MADPVNQMVTYISSVPGGLRFSCIVSISVCCRIEITV